LHKNIGHYYREWINTTGDAELVKFVTGSKREPDGIKIVSGDYYSTFDDTINVNPDITWYGGNIYPTNLEYSDNAYYPQHYTFGTPINIDDNIYNSNTVNSGYLFFDTGENLNAFYSIDYNNINRSDASINKFLYKIELISQDADKTPVLNSVKFTMNTKKDV
jgi:hypothetical protein